MSHGVVGAISAKLAVVVDIVGIILRESQRKAVLRAALEDWLEL